MRGLWPLPGPRANWDTTLRDLVVMAQDSPTRDVYLERIQESFSRVETTADKYAVLMVSLGFLSNQREGVNMTSRGRSIVKHPVQPTVRKVLLDDVEGITEILEVLEKRGPLRLGLLHEEVSPVFGWMRSSQVRYRIQWMQLGQLVEVVRERYPAYGLTNIGRRSLRAERSERLKSGH